MKLPIFIQRIINKATNAKFWYVTLDICPDFNTGQSEMCSYTINASDEQTARTKAIHKAMIEWDVDHTGVYIVDCTETKSDALIYNQ